VSVGGIGVSVGGIGVLVGGNGVSVGGTGVSVGGIGVFVDVDVGGTSVGCAVSVAAIAASKVDWISGVGVAGGSVAVGDGVAHDVTVIKMTNTNIPIFKGALFIALHSFR